jgi:hypothetical protein
MATSSSSTPFWLTPENRVIYELSLALTAKVHEQIEKEKKVENKRRKKDKGRSYLTVEEDEFCPIRFIIILFLNCISSGWGFTII